MRFKVSLKKNGKEFDEVVIANNKKAYRYLEQSIDQFPNQEIFLSHLKNVGFINITYINIIIYINININIPETLINK